jgi:hypothetical protein
VQRERRLWLAVSLAGFAVYAVRFFHFGYAEPEILKKGNAAIGLLDHLSLPFDLYRSGPGEGNKIFGLLLTPFYYVDDSRLLWEKVLGALFFAGGVISWTAALRRAIGVNGAFLFLLFNIFPPPFFEWAAHCAFWGNHFETYFFSGVMLYLFFRSADRPPGLVAAALLGLFARFALYYHAQNAPLIAALAVGACWRWRGRDLLRFLAPATAAFVVCPLRLDQVFLQLTQHRAAGGGAGAALRRLGELLFDRLPQSAGYDVFLRTPIFSPHGLADGALSRFLDAPVFSAFFFLLFLLGALGAFLEIFRPGRFLFWQRKNDFLSRVLLLFLAAWIAGFAVSADSFEPARNFLSHRYLLPLFPPMIAFVCIFVSLFTRRTQWLLAAPLLLAGALNTLTPLPVKTSYFADSFRVLTWSRGDDYASLIDGVVGRYAPGQPGGPEAVIARLPARWRAFGWRAFGRSCDAAEARRLLVEPPPWPTWNRDAAVFGMGAAAGDAFYQHICTSVAGPPGAAQPLALPEDMNGVDRATAERFVEGIGHGFLGGDRNDYPDICDGFAKDLSAGESRRALVEETKIQARTRLPELVRRFPQLTTEQFAAAFLRGAAYWLGKENRRWTPHDRPDFWRFWADAFGGDIPPDLEAIFAGEFYDGQAQYLIDRFHEFVYEGDPAGLPVLRAELEKRGVRLWPGRGTNAFALVIR